MSEIYAQDSDERDSDWGFGQVVALVLLLAPLITIIKYLTHGTPFTFYADLYTEMLTGYVIRAKPRNLHKLQ